jgi:hypothetical protein
MDAVGRTHFQDTCVSLSLEAGLVTLVSRAGQGAVKVQYVPGLLPAHGLVE